MTDFATPPGAFTAQGTSPQVLVDGIADRLAVRVNMTLWGTFVGTVQPEISFDNGLTWIQITDNGAPVSRTAPCTDVFEEAEQGVLYRWRCTAYTSGTINYRISF